MESKVIERFGRKFRVFTDGRVESLAFVDGRGRRIKSRLLKKSILPSGYPTYIVTINGKCHNMTVHRFVAEAFIEGFSKDSEVDHINGDRSDSSLSNLRCGTHSQNMRGHVASQKNVTSKYRGVHLHKRSGKWKASLSDHSTVIPLGTFENELDAAKAYNTKATELGFYPEALNQIPA
jgi:hypothetical protein